MATPSRESCIRSPKERPILMSGELVRATLERRKTQTRRPVKPQPNVAPDLEKYLPQAWEDGWVDVECPWGDVGDRLWVRECWAYFGGDEYLYQRDRGAVQYRADASTLDTPAGGRWRPSIHMPRWACRLVLEITDVRVQRLRDISEEDAKAEGMQSDADMLAALSHIRGADAARAVPSKLMSARERFAETWDRIYKPQPPKHIRRRPPHGKPISEWVEKHPETIPVPLSWHANPWVWAISFRRVGGAE